MISKTQRKRILIFVAVFMFIMLYNFVNTFIPGKTHDIISFAYMGFVVVWYLSIRERVISAVMRRHFLIGCASLVLLFLIRICKWNYFGMFPVANEFLQYLTYVPIILLPLVSLNISLRVGIYDPKRTREMTTFLWIVGIGFCISVLTNSMHDFVFVIHRPVGETLTYNYGAGYFAIVVFSLTCVISAFILLVHRCSLTASRRLAFIPILALILGISMIAGYYIAGGAPKLLGSKLYNIQEAFVFLFVVFWESSIQIGLIPTNSDYGTLFQASNLDAFISDTHDQVVYRTADSLRKALSPESTEASSDFRVTSQEILGGKVVWEDDISKINEIRASLLEVTKELSDENELLELEHETNSKKEELDSLMSLYDELYDSVRSEVRTLRALLSEIRKDEDLEKIKRAAVLGAFVKRRANLSILAHNAPDISINELEYALRESMYYISLTKTKCSVMVSGKGEVPAEDLIRMYEVFHAVSLELLGTECNIMVNVARRGKLHMKIMADRIVNSAFAEEIKEKFKGGTEVSVDKQEGITYIVCGV